MLGEEGVGRGSSSSEVQNFHFNKRQAGNTNEWNVRKGEIWPIRGNGHNTQGNIPTIYYFVNSTKESRVSALPTPDL